MDVLIAGAGIIGLATAYQLLRMRPDCKVAIVEKESGVARHQTSHNSGVVHSGAYYKPGSLKAINCALGRKELLQFCSQHEIPTKKLHKLIVATHEREVSGLLELSKRAQLNGISGAKIISQEEIKELEPNVSALKALLIPECHIVDYSKVAERLRSWIEEHQGQFIYNESVQNVQTDHGMCEVLTQKNSYRARMFLSCTGLFSDRLPRKMLKLNQRILPFRGEYYEMILEKRNIVSGLIYPVPDQRFPFLGVHLTPMMSGKLEAGPNAVLAFSREGYKKIDFNWKDTQDILSYAGFWKMVGKYWRAGCYELARSMNKRLFLRDLQKMVPCIEEKDLIPGESGVRAQIVTKEGKLLDDFSIQQEKNAIYVLNAPSPAATASFSIGQKLAEIALQGASL